MALPGHVVNKLFHLVQYMGAEEAVLGQLLGHEGQGRHVGQGLPGGVKERRQIQAVRWDTCSPLGCSALAGLLTLRKSCKIKSLCNLTISESCKV